MCTCTIFVSLSKCKKTPFCVLPMPVLRTSPKPPPQPLLTHAPTSEAKRRRCRVAVDGWLPCSPRPLRGLDSSRVGSPRACCVPPRCPAPYSLECHPPPPTNPHQPDRSPLLRSSLLLLSHSSSASQVPTRKELTQALERRGSEGLRAVEFFTVNPKSETLIPEP